MKGLGDGSYNIAVFLLPAPGEIFLACPAETDSVVGDIEDLPSLLPELWRAKFTAHLWDIKKVVNDMEASVNFAVASDTRAKYAEEGVSHVAILESTIINPGSEPFKLGAKVIRGNSVMVLYSADRNKYRLFHCQACGYMFAKWLEERQPGWHDAASGELQEGKNALN